MFDYLMFVIVTYVILLERTERYERATTVSPKND